MVKHGCIIMHNTGQTKTIISEVCFPIFSFQKLAKKMKRWIHTAIGNNSITNQLSDKLKIGSILPKILVQRGINSFEKARLFFRPSLEHLHDPFLMRDMDKAINRIEQALGDGEKILIYGDYDVDGTTAVSLVYEYFKCKSDLIEYYIPDRYIEGYGVSIQGIDYASANKFSLIICLDCGIKAVNKIAYAKEKDIDFIVCDHHLPGAQLPEAVAVLDPKRNDCDYPYKELSGCGIGFKLVQAFSQKHKESFKGITPLLDLVCVSIGADIVPITGENRVLAFYGLQEVNKRSRIGLKQMLNLSSKKGVLNITDIVFTIAPRINAAGRIESGKKAVELLTTNDSAAAEQIAKSINENNTTRKGLDKQIYAEALTQLESISGYESLKSTVVYQPNWHKGVIGIVASRLIEKHYRPTIVLTKSGDKVAGSARSVNGFSVYTAIEQCQDVIEQFGGHKYAAGLTMKEENVKAFQQKFESVVSASISPEMLTPEIKIDAEMKLSDISAKFFRILKQFAPFGPENMRPIFVSHNLKDTGYAKIVGEDHLKFRVTDEHGIAFNCIAFKQAQYLDLVRSGALFSIAYTIEENEWQGNISLQLNVYDIKLSSTVN